jgi:ribosomal protein S14
MRRMSLNGMRSRLAYMRTTDRPPRQALRYIIRNTTLPQRVRAQAQLQLSEMHCYTRFTQIKNRCIMGGKGRGVFSDFRMGRVCFAHSPGHVRLANAETVPIPRECPCWKLARSEEGKLVDVGRGKICETCVYYHGATQYHRVAFLQMSCFLSNHCILGSAVGRFLLLFPSLTFSLSRLLAFSRCLLLLLP